MDRARAGKNQPNTNRLIPIHLYLFHYFNYYRRTRKRTTLQYFLFLPTAGLSLVVMATSVHATTSLEQTIVQSNSFMTHSSEDQIYRQAVFCLNFETFWFVCLSVIFLYEEESIWLLIISSSHRNYLRNYLAISIWKRKRESTRIPFFTQ